MSVVFYWYLRYGAVSSTISLAEYVAKLPLKYEHLRTFPQYASGYIFYDVSIINELESVFRPSSFKLYEPIKLEILHKGFVPTSIDGWV